jgi:hypothetical protein
MGFVSNTFALLASLAAFAAAWSLPRRTLARQVGWVHFLGGVGILALFYSIVSPDDNGFQQELIRPATFSITVSAQAKVAPRRALASLSIHAFAEAGDPIRISRTGRSFVVNQPFEFNTPFHAPIAIHSPPLAS